MFPLLLCALIYSVSQKFLEQTSFPSLQMKTLSLRRVGGLLKTFSTLDPAPVAGLAPSDRMGFFLKSQEAAGRHLEEQVEGLHC